MRKLQEPIDLNTRPQGRWKSVNQENNCSTPPTQPTKTSIQFIRHPLKN
jgi:hypothetical protein